MGITPSSAVPASWEKAKEDNGQGNAHPSFSRCGAAPRPLTSTRSITTSQSGGSTRPVVKTTCRSVAPVLPPHPPPPPPSANLFTGSGSSSNATGPEKGPVVAAVSGRTRSNPPPLQAQSSTDATPSSNECGATSSFHLNHNNSSIDNNTQHQYQQQQQQKLQLTDCSTKMFGNQNGSPTRVVTSSNGRTSIAPSGSPATQRPRSLSFGQLSQMTSVPACTVYRTTSNQVFQFEKGVPEFNGAQDITPCFARGGLYRLVRVVYSSIGEEVYEESATRTPRAAAAEFHPLPSSPHGRVSPTVRFTVPESRAGADATATTTTASEVDRPLPSSRRPTPPNNSNGSATGGRPGSPQSEAAASQLTVSTATPPPATATGAEDSDAASENDSDTSFHLADIAREWTHASGQQVFISFTKRQKERQKRDEARRPLCQPSRTTRMPIVMTAIEQSATARRKQKRRWHGGRARRLMPWLSDSSEDEAENSISNNLLSASRNTATERRSARHRGKRLYQLTMSEMMTWAFYNDTEDKVMWVRTVFGASSQLTALGTTSLVWGCDGSTAPAGVVSDGWESSVHTRRNRALQPVNEWVAEVMVPPLSTVPFVEGKIKGGYRMKCAMVDVDHMDPMAYPPLPPQDWTAPAPAAALETAAATSTAPPSAVVGTRDAKAASSETQAASSHTGASSLAPPSVVQSAKDGPHQRHQRRTTTTTTATSSSDGTPVPPSVASASKAGSPKVISSVQLQTSSPLLSLPQLHRQLHQAVVRTTASGVTEYPTKARAVEKGERQRTPLGGAAAAGATTTTATYAFPSPDLLTSLKRQPSSDRGSAAGYSDGPVLYEYDEMHAEMNPVARPLVPHPIPWQELRRLSKAGTLSSSNKVPSTHSSSLQLEAMVGDYWDGVAETATASYDDGKRSHQSLAPTISASLPAGTSTASKGDDNNDASAYGVTRRRLHNPYDEHSKSTNSASVSSTASRDDGESDRGSLIELAMSGSLHNHSPQRDCELPPRQHGVADDETEEDTEGEEVDDNPPSYIYPPPTTQRPRPPPLDSSTLAREPGLSLNTWQDESHPQPLPQRQQQLPPSSQRSRSESSAHSSSSVGTVSPPHPMAGYRPPMTAGGPAGPRSATGLRPGLSSRSLPQANVQYPLPFHRLPVLTRAANLQPLPGTQRMLPTLHSPHASAQGLAHIQPEMTAGSPQQPRGITSGRSPPPPLPMPSNAAPFQPQPRNQPPQQQQQQQRVPFPRPPVASDPFFGFPGANLAQREQHRTSTEDSGTDSQLPGPTGLDEGTVMVDVAESVDNRTVVPQAVCRPARRVTITSSKTDHWNAMANESRAAANGRHSRDSNIGLAVDSSDTEAIVHHHNNNSHAGRSIGSSISVMVDPASMDDVPVHGEQGDGRGQRRQPSVTVTISSGGSEMEDEDVEGMAPMERTPAAAIAPGRRVLPSRLL